MKTQLSNFTIPTPTTDQLNILVKNKPLTPQSNDRKKTQNVSAEAIREFTDAYEDKKTVKRRIKIHGCKSAERKDTKTPIQGPKKHYRDSFANHK
jgi:hypothetical protein